MMLIKYYKQYYVFARLSQLIGLIGLIGAFSQFGILGSYHRRKIWDLGIEFGITETRYE